MKTLAQIEPRTPISSLPFTVTSPGAYYVTTNLAGRAANHGIVIQADDVTLDLNGFVLSGTPEALKGILVAGTRRNIVIRNGTISDWRAGVDAETASYGRFESLRILSNTGTGLAAGANSVITSCTAVSNEAHGIQADRDSRINDCTARGNFFGASWRAFFG